MKHKSTLFLKAAVILMGITLLSLGLLGFVWLLLNPVNPVYAPTLMPLIIGIYVSFLPILFALSHAFILLNRIDRGQAFSEFSVRALGKIKDSFYVISALSLIMLPFTYMLAEKDDAPGLIIIGLVFLLAAFLIAVFFALLQTLLQEAREQLVKPSPDDQGL